MGDITQPGTQETSFKGNAIAFQYTQKGGGRAMMSSAVDRNISRRPKDSLSRPPGSPIRNQ